MGNDEVKIPRPPVLPRQIRAAMALTMVFQSVFDPRAPPTGRISEQAMHHQYLRSVPSLRDCQVRVPLR